MASQVLSGTSNPSYTNNTGQNVRLLMNYIADCTSMTWAGVTVTGDSTVGKDVMTINGEIRSFEGNGSSSAPGDLSVSSTKATGFLSSIPGVGSLIQTTPTRLSAAALTGLTDVATANAHYIPLTVTPGGEFPTELVLADGEAFSALSGAFNIVVIKEDGT
tara:strand:- start:22 stop:504 length:483 start_codon:yes stop_codon:yes gene_type:complete